MRPYTRREMQTDTVGERRGVRFEALYAEAKEALGYAANRLRALTERSREVYAEATAQWHETEARLHHDRDNEPADPERRQLGRSADMQAAEIAQQKMELARLEAVVRNLESSWLFLERGADGRGDPANDGQMRPSTQLQIVEAQEAERSRLAQEIHDGPAQTLSNAVFQIEYIEKVIDKDSAAAQRELRTMAGSLRRELEEMRAFIHQLQNPLIGALGLNGALRESAENIARAAGVELQLDLSAPDEVLDEAQQTVVLRVAQEALRNVRKHAGASHVRLTTRLDRQDPSERAAYWLAEVKDDGKGFDAQATAMRSGGRNFGLRFMRERAELIGADITIESRAGEGTTVRLGINGVERR
jgi:two-component system, NarL family, sensor histidine kinase DegS